MIVYGDRSDKVNTRSLLGSVDSSIRFGQIEAAIVDALCPEVDDWTPLIQLLREDAVSGCYERALGCDLPDEVRIRTAEGFAWYALYPDQYRAAARRFVREVRPDRCVTVGIRSIGTTLSTVVQEVVGGASFTVRPRGHPFNREVRITPALADVARQGNWALVVDEGPGLSGSSFVSVCDMLLELGFAESRIVLFPSHDPDPAQLISERARRMWPRFRKYTEPFRACDYVPAEAVDLSGGKWREYLGIDVEVAPHLERRKYLDLSAGVLWKWAGLAHYGRARLERAERLAGMVPRARGVDDGFLLTDWMDGKAATSVNEELLDAMARYLARLGREFRTGMSVNYESLSEMIYVNTGIEIRPPEADAETVAVDGRMMPHEWLLTNNGWLKTDALDHHDDHMFPGCQDIAWDIAGAAVEFGFDAALLAERCLRLCPDSGLMRRLPFHTTAYTAWRAGYNRMFGLAGASARGS